MDYRKQILKIRSDYLKGKIDLDEARAKVEPLLKTMNRIGKEIAKKHGRRFNELTFGYVMR